MKKITNLAAVTGGDMYQSGTAAAKGAVGAISEVLTDSHLKGTAINGNDLFRKAFCSSATSFLISIFNPISITSQFIGAALAPPINKFVNYALDLSLKVTEAPLQDSGL